MMRSRNVIVTDFKVDKNWLFGQSFAKQSKISDWEFEGYDNCGIINSIFDSVKRYLLYFVIPIKYFFCYKQLNLFVAYQQFYGIILAYYLRLFHRKEQGSVIVLTFIYNRKKGWIGSVYHKFIQYSIESTYIKKIICFSKSELKYYKAIFPKTAEKFEFVHLGKASHGLERIEGETEFLIAAGRSNRDYDFLIDALQDTDYNLKIVTDNLSEVNKKKLSSRIQLYDNTIGEDYLKLLQCAKIVLIPLENAKISSGQLVTLQAMEMGVPVIVIGSNAADDYIENNVNGYIIDKNKTELINVLKELVTNKVSYDTIAENAKKTYVKYGSIDAMAQKITRIVESMEIE